MTTITNVRWIVYGQRPQREVHIADKMDKGDLFVQLKRATIKAPETKMGEELALAYRVGTEDVYITIVNLTSDVPEEHFRYALNEYVVIASIEDDVDYGFDYNDAKLRAADVGISLKQDEYVEDRRR